MNIFFDHKTSRARGMLLSACFVIGLLGATMVSGQTSSTQSGSTSRQAAGVHKSPRLTAEQLTDQSDVIAVGKVTSLRSEWNKEQTRIYTHVTLSVDEFLKGSEAQNVLTIAHLGGEVGRVGELYSETATFQKNEEVMVFAKKDPKGMYRVTGADQGKISVMTDKLTGKKMIGASISLDNFKSKIKGVLNSQKEK